MMKNMKLVILAIVFLGANPVQAKGLDELNPETPETKAPEPEKKTEETAPAENSEVKAEPEKALEAEKPAEAAVTAEVKPVEPSATSRKLADKLFLTTGLYFNRLQGTKGDWDAGGGRSEVAVHYLVSKEPFKSGMLKHVDILASARYAPVDVTLRSNRQSYTGVVEGFHFGVLLTRLFTEKFRSVGGIEASYYSVHLESADSFPEPSSAAKNGAGATFVGGCDWIFANKMTLGPRVDLSVGSFHGFSVGGAAGFVF